MPAERSIPGGAAGAGRAAGLRRRPARLVVAPLLAALLAVPLPAVPMLGAPSAAAQGLSLGNPSDNRPIEITADSGIEWQQQAQVYVARGNAVAKRGTSEVHADILTAHYRPNKTAEGGTEIYRLDADGHVLIKGPTQSVVGDQAIYDVDQAIAIITGKALKLTTARDTVTARDSFEWYDQKQVAVARGDAVAVRDDRRIRADVLTAHMTKDKTNTPGAKPTGTKPAAAGPEAKPAQSGPANSGPAQAKPAQPGPAQSGPAQRAAGPGGSAHPLDAADEGGSRISRVDAQGNVVVSNATDIGRGDYGVYNADTGIVTLLGNVTITRGQNVIRGQYAVVDLNRNVSRMMTVAAKPGAPAPRVEGVFVRQEGAAGSLPAAGARQTSAGHAPAGIKRP